MKPSTCERRESVAPRPDDDGFPSPSSTPGVSTAASSPISNECVSSALLEPLEVVAELCEELMRRRPGQVPVAVVFFCDGLYPLQALADALKQRFACPLLGCTSGSQIGPGGFRRGGVSLLACYGQGLRLRTFLIEPLAQAEDAARQIAAELSSRPLSPGWRRFGLLLVDGLHQGEERLAHALYHGLEDVPFIGGSASDEMRFEHTPVYFDGRFRSNAAVFGLFETSQPFLAFRVQHFVPRRQRLVITEADPERRLVIQINGLPAAEVYAQVLGVAEADLVPELLETHPLLLRVGESQVVRAISRVTRSRALLCLSAVETGVLVDVGDATSPLEALRQGFDAVESELGETALVLGCDCTLRRRQAERRNQLAEVGDFLAAHRVFGFSTHGEQFNGLHINQTFTAIAVAAGTGSP
jgi:hypothetical protein